jgi:hypothetical protein
MFKEIRPLASKDPGCGSGKTAVIPRSACGMSREVDPLLKMAMLRLKRMRIVKTLKSPLLGFFSMGQEPSSFSVSCFTPCKADNIQGRVEEYRPKIREMYGRICENTSICVHIALLLQMDKTKCCIQLDTASHASWKILKRHR